MKKIILICLTIFLLLAANALAAEKPQFVPNEIIVKFKIQTPKVVSDANPETGITTIDELNSKHKIKSMEKIVKKRDKIYQKQGLDRVFLLKTSENEDLNELIKDYSNNPNVESAEPNCIIKTTLEPNDANYSLLYGLNNLGQTGGIADADIDAPESWNITTGSSNVIVAVIDTGIDYNHPDLAANIWTNPGEIPNNGIDDDNNGFVDDVNGWNFFSNSNNSFDDNGHGTHVSGTIGAIGNNSIGVVGVNWKVTILPIKALDFSGAGTISGAVNAVIYGIQMHADIISNSWGGCSFSPVLEDAIKAANDANILFVAAAGNEGRNSDIFPTYPASYDVPNVISVAATDDRDLKVFFSNYGASSVDLGAPGVNIYSTVPNGTCMLCDSSGYRYLSGTSMATPHVSGVAALIKSKFPDLKASALRLRLMGTVDKVNSLNGKTLSGGRINAFSALEDDNSPPAAVTDLQVVETSIDSIELKWTASGDDGDAGTARFYDLRYSKTPINNLNWGNATKIDYVTSPKPAFSPEAFEVKNLMQNTTYYFALKVIDNVGNPSDLSNSALGRTLKPRIMFKDNFEDILNKWSATGLWHLENKRSFSPNKSWAYNTGTPNYNYDVGTTKGYLTSPKINLSNAKSAILKFKYGLETDDYYDESWIEIGVNGEFTKVAKLWAGPISNWNDFSIDISKYTGKSNIQVRFFFNSINSFLNNFEGWYIDDVYLLGNGSLSADAGPDQFLVDVDGNGIEEVTLDGTKSIDMGGDITNYLWTEQNTILNNKSIFTNNFSIGIHIINLTIIDDNGLQSSDLTNITILTKTSTFNDTFNRADSSILGNGWNEVSGDFQILNNQLRNVGIGTHKAVEDGFFGFNLSAAADFASINNIHGPRFGIMLRYQDPNNYYLFYRSVGGSSTLRISKVVNGVETILVKKAISNPSINVPFRIEGRVVGNTLTFYLNGLKKAEIIDSTFSSGKSGIYVKAPSAKSHIVDNFFATKILASLASLSITGNFIKKAKYQINNLFEIISSWSK